MPAWVIVRVADGLLEGEFVSVPVGCAFPIRLPNRRPTLRPLMFDPLAPTQISHTTVHYLLPNANRADQLTVTHRPPPSS
jgi:hypothetical protein